MIYQVGKIYLLKPAIQERTHAHAYVLSSSFYLNPHTLLPYFRRIEESAVREETLEGN